MDRLTVDKLTQYFSTPSLPIGSGPTMPLTHFRRHAGCYRKRATYSAESINIMTSYTDMQAVGGRLPWYAPLRPATEEHSGILEAGRAGPDQPIRAIQPASRTRRPPANRMYATDVRQTDVRHHNHLMPPGRGHNKYNMPYLHRVKKCPLFSLL